MEKEETLKKYKKIVVEFEERISLEIRKQDNRKFKEKYLKKLEKN